MDEWVAQGLTSYGDAASAVPAQGVHQGHGLFRRCAGSARSSVSPTPYSDYNPCHGNVPQIIEAAKRGVMLSGAMPFVFPTISIAESFAHPTSMYCAI